MMTTIVFTGGGSAGHVTPNIALIDRLLNEKAHWQVAYIGSNNGIEKKLITAKNITYYGVASGKLRRYFSWQNFIDPFKISFGIVQSWFLLGKLKPKIVFSKGGFVSFPIVVAAWLRRIPVLIHESDFTPGLANRLSFPFAKKVLITFPETKKYLPAKTNVIATGTPIRQQFFLGDAQKARQCCDFMNDKKVILVIGGSAGAGIINDAIRQALPQLLANFNVIHLCGQGKVSADFTAVAGYRQFEYLQDELFDMMALADIVISRSGANSLYELVALKKLHILVPLSKKASRGDQIVNANYFANKGISKVIPEEEFSSTSLLSAVKDLEEHAATYQMAREKYEYQNGTEIIYNLLSEELQ